MKTKKLTQIALLATFVAATPVMLAQQSPSGGGTATEPGANTLRPGRPASQPGGPGAGQTGAAGQQAGQSSITTIVGEASTFSTLEKALKAADLDKTLSDEQGSFTLFAPTDAAFDKLPAGTLDRLLRQENKDKLRTLLLNHVVSGKMLAADLKSGNIKTMSGETIQLTATAGDVQVGGSRVSSADRVASNGVVHTIGEVLVPKSIDLQQLNK